VTGRRSAGGDRRDAHAHPGPVTRATASRVPIRAAVARATTTPARGNCCAPVQIVRGLAIDCRIARRA